MNKYRVHEVAKDFKTTSKVITEVLTKYAETPKNHMQVLTDHELNIIFDYLTLNNQISDMSEVFASGAPAKKEEAPAAQAAPAQEKPAQQQNKDAKPQQPKQNAPQQQAKPQQQEKPAQAAQPAQQPQSRVPQKRIVDTSGATLNAAKYDERLDNFVPDRLANAKQGKEKFAKRDKRGNNMAQGNKKRQEQKAQMQKLQLEIAKKAPTKVSIPD
ncbi:MAG: translation initiation factor IF-2 N-terminal domain-containing protein, partial [Oscillospiraceae bacterium]|nr:translation initiation factor IF-2 N-terminal domain-containing protein [Oscillospiraceae bacterium]